MDGGRGDGHQDQRGRAGGRAGRGDEREGFLAQGTREALLGIDWLRPDFVNADGAVRLAFHALVIETPTHRIVVDTCVGNDKHRPSHHFWQHRKKPKGKPRSESLRRCQQGQIQNTRAVEHVFAQQKAHTALFIRTIGIKRAQAKITLANLAHNPEIARQAAHLTVYQRTASYTVLARDAPMPFVGGLAACRQLCNRELANGLPSFDRSASVTNDRSDFVAN